MGHELQSTETLAWRVVTTWLLLLVSDLIDRDVGIAWAVFEASTSTGEDFNIQVQVEN